MLYTLGFIFDENLEYVLLIKKNAKISILEGKWNGLGGKLTEHESVFDGYFREIKEESGLDLTILPAENHKLLGEFNIPTNIKYPGRIYIFATKATKHLLLSAKTTTDEEVDYFRVEDLRKMANTTKVKGNITWMIEMARNVLLDLDRCKYFVINET